ncbi:hypothetical protein C8R44DRAFT_930731, partial [Mycena epipterygia]
HRRSALRPQILKYGHIRILVLYSQRSWVKKLHRRSRSVILKKASAKGILETEQDDGRNYTRTAPRNTPFIEWMYEMDLDHQVFLVDSHPLFALGDMPDSPELFVESVGFNSYGHRACTPSTPKQHIYNWMSARPVVKDDAIERYAVDQQHPKLIVEDLLGIAG